MNKKRAELLMQRYEKKYPKKTFKLVRTAPDCDCWDIVEVKKQSNDKPTSENTK